jgi:membrane protein YqaA with SNARE-associated domain
VSETSEKPVEAAADAPGPDAESADEPKKKGILRRLYDWVLHWAETPYGLPALVILAIAESSFFPIPPDVLLIALAISIPAKAFRYAAWCTAGSVFGGVIGYLLGWGMWEAVQPIMIPAVFHEDKFDRVMEIYREWGVVFVFVAGFSPIPYKIFTIAAGVAKLNLAAFVGTSIIGRGARFFLVAAVIRKFGSKAKEIIDKYFNLVTLAFTVLLVGSFVLLKVVL